MAILKQENQLYTVEEVMELTGLAKQTVYKYLRAGDLKGVKMGRVWRVSDASLKKFSRVGVKPRKEKTDG